MSDTFTPVNRHYAEEYLPAWFRPAKTVVFLSMARQLSSLSTCSRLEVGAIITDTRYRIIGAGYNGSPTSTLHCKDLNPEKDKGKCRCIHAEQNAILNAQTRPGVPLVAFVTAFPCDSCQKLLRGFGVTHVFYLDDYRYFETCRDVADDLGLYVYRYDELSV